MEFSNPGGSAELKPLASFFSASVQWRMASSQSVVYQRAEFQKAMRGV
jgi:hypothetical protein